MIRGFLYILCLSLLITINGYSQSVCSSFSTYFGGTQFDEIKGICVDGNKNSYIIGNTFSLDLPITNGLLNDTASGNYDVFIAKIDSCGGLIWCTYFGTTNFDSGEKIALSPDGNIVFCGFTSGLNLPVSSGCFQPANNGGYDCFITKITPTGSLIWSTYFGKSNGDFAYDIATDLLNNIIIGGTTTSANLYTSPSSFQPNHKGNTDSFIARFSKDGVLKWCTYYGGNGNEDIHALAIDHNFNIIGVGGSFSSNLNTSAGAYQSINEGSPDAYIIKLDSNCSRVFSTYFGGTSIEDAWGVVIDLQNNIYVSGNTNSIDFDTTLNAYQTSLLGVSDLYISKWSPSGALLNSTYFGGTGNDLSSRLAFMQPNNLMLLGKTESSDMPIIGSSNQPNNAGNYDNFLVLFNSNTLQPVWSSYYGGSTDEEPIDISFISHQSVVFSGSTNSINYPLSLNPYQNFLNASNDGMLTKIDFQNPNVTSIKNYSSNIGLSVFPNPFTDYLYVSSPQEFSIQITNIIGQSVFVSKNKKQIDTRNFEKGVYLISIETINTINTYKIIKD